MRERFEDAYPPRLNGGFCKERNWYERKDDGRWYPDIERNHQWNIWQKAWQAGELSLQQQNAELLAALIWISVESESTAMVISRTRISMAAKEAIAKAGVK